MGKMKFYNVNKLLEREPDAAYYVIIGERSNGKTFSVMQHIVEDYLREGAQAALIRRMDIDFKQKRGDLMFSNLVDSGVLLKISGGKWSGVYYRAMRWWLCNYDEDGKPILDDKPFCFGYALTAMEHDKSSGGTTNIRNVLFDEFLARTYLPDEFILFTQTLSSIIRHRNDVKIFMCGNTINPYAPYFGEMGLTRIKQMKKGDIDVYTYGTSGLKVAVEFADSPAKNKPSDVYFAFDNPRLSMITGKGNVWELDIYPHVPERYVPFDVLFTYFIVFDGEVLQCECIRKDNGHSFTYIHRKTTPLQNDDKDLIYSLRYDPRPNWRRRMTRPRTPIERYILSQFQQDKVYYQDNEVGMMVENYLNASGKGERGE